MKSEAKKSRSELIYEELQAVIQEHLTGNQDISVRSFVRKMSLINNASSITRNSRRMDLIKQAQTKQSEIRSIAARSFKLNDESDKALIVKLKKELADAKRIEENLKISIGALIRAAAIHGVDWVSFFERYKLNVNDFPLPDNVRKTAANRMDLED